MSKNNAFNPARFFLLIRKDLDMSLSTIISAVKTIQTKTIMLFVFSLFTMAGFIFWMSTYTRGPFFNEALFMFLHDATGLIFVFLGWFITGIAFKEIHRSEESYSWLTLPSSSLEKYLARLLLTSFGFILLATFLYTFYVAILAGFIRLFISHIVVPFKPFDAMFLEYIAIYLVYHSVFILGAVIFKQLAFFKTLLIILTFIVGIIIFGNYLTENLGETLLDPQMEVPRMAMRIIFYGILAPVCWCIGYILLKRKEA